MAAPAPNAANIAQHLQQIVQNFQGLADEGQHLLNWQPAQQPAVLAQLVQGQQQMQQTQQQMQQTLLQVQQALQQQSQALQQVQLALQQVQQTQQEQSQQLDNAEHNALVRTLNSRLNMQQPVAWVLNGAGQAPQQPTMELWQLQGAISAVVDPLLNHYGLTTGGLMHDRRHRLLRHLGILAP